MSITAVKVISVFFLLIGGWITIPFFASDEVLLMSLESKTVIGGDVYNKIKFIPGLKQDIWMMNQSHYGLTAHESQWDRLAIIVDKSKDIKTARFLQLPPGELLWSDDLYKKSRELKISCFVCHSNGPRAIRADQSKFSIGFAGQWKIFIWNYRIKSYGRIKETKEQENEDLKSKTPFRHRAELDNEILMVKSCTKCHYESGSSGRGFLTRQNSVTIKFMMDNKLMPPPTEKISAMEREKVKDFTLGL